MYFFKDGYEYKIDKFSNFKYLVKEHKYFKIAENYLKVNGISYKNEYVLDELTKISSFLEEELSEKEIEILKAGNII